MRDDFRERLLESGLLVDTGVNGLYGHSGDYEAVVSGLGAMIDRAGADQGARVVQFTPLMPRRDFERTGYVQNFPDLLGALYHFEGTDKEHRRLLELADAGQDWTGELTAGETTLISSACHPLYPTLTGVLPSEGLRVDLLGWCFRHEPSLDPGRMQTFRQREFVYLGSAEGALAHRDLWVERGLDLLKRLQLSVQAEVANDPFFGRTGRLLANEQREAALKIELVAPLGSLTAMTAIASSNLAGDHFGHTFGIQQVDGQIANSACIGFGLDRITLALVREHGTDIAVWPDDVKAELWP